MHILVQARHRFAELSGDQYAAIDERKIYWNYRG
jgi:hypothetical protein